jgi:hypothetical protein
MQKYMKKAEQPMEPWTTEIDMVGVSISDPDLENGSPMGGDMIAVNANDPSDRWLIAESFFNENYALVEAVGEPMAIPDSPLGRAVNELDQLADRLNALTEFRKSEAHTALSKTKQRDLRMQAAAMSEYGAILSKRIQGWDD